MTEWKNSIEANRSLTEQSSDAGNKMQHSVEVPFLGELSMAEFSELATRIEAALSDDRSALESLSAQVAAAMASHVRQAPPTVSAVVHGEGSMHEDLNVAYALGHLSLAHLLLEHTSSRRAVDAFYEAFEDPKYVGIIAALARAEMTNSVLAEEEDIRPETVSRHLRALRELGISEFRKIGTQVYNYLTPAARAYRSGVEAQLDIPPRQTRISLDEKVREIPTFMRKQAILID